MIAQLPPQLVMSRAIILERMLRQEIKHGAKIHNANALSSARELGFKGRTKAEVLKSLSEWIEAKWKRIYRPDVMA